MLTFIYFNIYLFLTITGIPPLPVNIHTMKAMPTALSQVNQLFSIAMNYEQQQLQQH